MQSPEDFRIRDRKMPGSMEANGNEGCFVVPHYEEQMEETHFFVCIATEDKDWEKVSVTVNRKDKKLERPPNFRELAHIKKLFWGANETVVVYFPALFGHVPAHPNCQVLYRPVKHPLPIPEEIKFI